MSGSPAREPILQFGTGRFLLGFVDQARQAGYDGKVVVVQSTGADRADLINRADGRYAIQVHGQRNGALVDERRIAPRLDPARFDQLRSAPSLSAVA